MLRILRGGRRAPLHLPFLLLLSLALPATLAGQVGMPAEGAVGGVFLDSVRVEGNARLDASVVTGTAGLQAGTFVTFRNVQDAVKALMNTGQFEDVRVRAEGEEGDAVLLVIEVEEREFVRSVLIEGLERFRSGEVLDSTGLASGMPYSPSRVAAARNYIRDRLTRLGVPFADVQEFRRDVPDQEGTIDLILSVAEGHRVTVADVTFEGNRIFSDGDLRSVMSTKPEGFLWFRGGRYDEVALDEDLRTALPDFYAAAGHLDFQVLSDTLIIDPRTGKSRLEITVDEGPRYLLGEFEIEGNRHFPTEQLRLYFQNEEGGLLRSLGLGGAREGARAVDAVAFREAALSVEQLYKNNGYLYARVTPVLERRDPVPGQPPVVDIAWRIVEQTPAYIRSVRIAGNEYTYDRVIREQIPVLPGDTYSEALLIQGYQNIQALGFFETPMEPPSILPDETTGDVDIVFNVKEKQTGSINFGTSMGGYTGVAGFLGYDQPNLFGQGKSGSLRWDFGRYQNNFNLTYTDPALWQSRISGAISLFNQRDRFIRFDTGERRRIGASARFGLPLPGMRYTRLFVGYSLSETKYRMHEGAGDSSLFGLPPGTQSQLSLSLTRQTINHPIFPTAGSRQSFTSEMNGGFLGGDGKFTRQLLEGTWYVPAGRLGGATPGASTMEFALGLTVKAGAVFGDASRFPFERFWLGGVQFGESLRGYDETTITPMGYFERGDGRLNDLGRLGNAFTTVSAQYTSRIQNNIGISLFYEAGGLWRNVRAVDPSRLYRGAGIGFQLVTPFGPIGLDYAYGFDKSDPGWQLHFRFGQGF